MKTIGGGRYRLDSLLASGSFGRVFSSGPLAIKQLRVPSHSSQARAIHSVIANQIRVLTRLNHSNVVRLFEVLQEGEFVYLIMELCQGDLRQYTQTGPVSQQMACRLLKEIVKGYGQLVKMGVVHRDLKPANVLIAGGGGAKLADFGMARLFEEGELLRSRVGTPYYMAPQLLQRIEYTRKCDVWSMGVIFYELVCGSLPWNGRNQQTLLSAIMTQSLRIPPSVSGCVRELLEGMLTISEGRRLGWQQVGRLLELREGYSQIERSFHWSEGKEMLILELQDLAKQKKGKGYEVLSGEERSEVKDELQLLIRDEQKFLLGYLRQM